MVLLSALIAVIVFSSASKGSSLLELMTILSPTCQSIASDKFKVLLPTAAGTLIFVGGIGAIGAPVFVGYAMTALGPNSFFHTMIVLMASIAVYGTFRLTRRVGIRVDDAMSYTAVMPQSTQIVAEIAQEIAIENEAEASDLLNSREKA